MFCVIVDALCCVIPATTKDLPSLRKKEMLITCVAFCLLLFSLKGFRSALLTSREIFSGLLRLFLFSFWLFNLVIIIVQQEKRLMHNLRQYDVPLHRYMALMDLQVLLGFLLLWPLFSLTSYTLFVLSSIKFITFSHCFYSNRRGMKGCFTSF